MEEADMVLEGSDELQIDVGYGSKPEQKISTGSASEGHSAMTWLQAAEYVLREEGGPGMHIRELTRTILELGMVKSNCSTSLETLLYRQTSKESSKFIRVPGKMGWFGLKKGYEMAEGQEEEETPVISSIIAPPVISVSKIHVNSGGGGRITSSIQRPVIVQSLLSAGQTQQHTLQMTGGEGSGMGVEGKGVEREGWNFHPKVVYKKRSSEYSASGSDESDWSTSSDEDSEALYHKRYVFTKKMAKSIIYENVAMAEQLQLIEQKIATAEAERQFLLEKFMKFNQKIKSVPPSLPGSTVIASNTKSVFKASDSTVSHPISVIFHSSPATGPPPLIPMSSLTTTSSSKQSQQEDRESVISSTPFLSTLLTKDRTDTRTVSGIDRGKNINNHSIKSDNTSIGLGGQRSPNPLALASGHSSLVSSSSDSEEIADDGKSGGGVCTGDGGSVSKGDDHSVSAVLGATEEAGSKKTKGNRRKMGNKVRRLHPIPLNEDGSPVLPIQIGGLKVHCLGKIIFDRVAYHSERYLLPVGFHSSRTYPSMLSPSQRTTYHCTILDGGDAPIFEMRAVDDADNPVQASSSTACQSIVLKAINKARDRQATNSGSGPEFFGYSNPTILNLLQKLPNAARCSKYRFIKKFDSPVWSSAPSAKSKTKRKQQRREKDGEGPQTKKMRMSVSPKPAIHDISSSSNVKTSSGEGMDPSLAPVLGSGMGQLRMETMMGLYSSSDEWSSSDTEHELTV